MELDQIEAELARRARSSLPLYTRLAWPLCEGSQIAWNWHLDAISDHLTAVSNREIPRLIINIPPRHMKSYLTCVFWQTWEWTNRPRTQFLFASYASILSIRDNVRARRLIESPWYQANYQVQLAADQNQKTRYDNTAGGYRVATSVGGSATGEGGDILVIDDPLSSDQARSEKARTEAIDWYTETLRFRMNDPKTGRIVMIMQRLHEDDLSGHILATETGWDHLCLPGRYEVDHPHPVRSSLGFTDPRAKDGDLLWPDRFGPAELDNIAPEGSYTYAGQVQQRPAPRAGGLFKIDNIAILTDAPKCIKLVRRWDLAATEEGGDWTVGVLLGLREDGLGWVVLDVVRGQWGPGNVRLRIAEVAEADRTMFGRVKLVLPQEPGAAGKDQRNSFADELAAHSPRFVRESGDKEARAEPFAAQVELGRVSVVQAAWTQAFIGELQNFPKGSHDDQVDAAAGAFAELHVKRAGRVRSFSGM